MRTEIFIERRLPVINQFVSVPDGQISLRNKLTPAAAEAAIPGSSTIFAYVLGKTQGLQVSGGLGTNRQWFILPERDRESRSINDFFGTRRQAAQ